MLTSRLKSLRKIIKRILIIYWGFFGDVLITTPFLRTLRKGFPKAHITYIVAGFIPGIYSYAAKILENNPDVDRWIRPDSSIFATLLKEKPYDLAIDLCAGKTSKLTAKMTGAKIRLIGRFRGLPSWCSCYICLDGKETSFLKIPIRDNRLVKRNVYKHRIGQFLELADFLGIDIKKVSMPKIYLSNEERRFSKQYFKKIKSKKTDRVIAIQPGGRNRQRLWNTRNYAMLADKMIEKYNVKVLVLYAPDEKTFADKVCGFSYHKLTKASERDIRKYISIISGCDVFISTDGGPLHIALALGVPSVGIFRDKKAAMSWYNYKQRRGLFSVSARQSYIRKKKKKEAKINKRDLKEVESALKKAGQALHFSRDERNTIQTL